MRKIAFLILIYPFLFYAQRPKSDNIFHNKSFWETKPNVTIVKQKIKEGNDPVSLNYSQFDAVCFAIFAKAPIESIDYLLSIPGNNINKLTHDKRSYLIWAGYSGDIGIMKLLLNKNADPKIVGSHGFNWLTFTANAGHLNTDIYDLMLTNNVDLNTTTRSGANALLLLAPYAKDSKILNYFIEKGLDINSKDHNGNSILFYAAQHGNITLIKNLIKKGFDYKQLNSKGENLAFFATYGARNYQNPLTVYQYFESLKLDLTQTNSNGKNVLHNLAGNVKDISILDFFIKKEISINLKDKKGYTPLIYATKRVNTKSFDFLIQKGANIQMTDTNQNNLYYHLFNTYNKRNKTGFDYLSNALVSANVSFKNASKNTPPLHIAIEKEEKELIIKAIELGADINQKNKEGLTPLHIAAMKAKNNKILKLLLNTGADKNILTNFEESAYGLAKENELLINTDITFLK